MTINPRYPIYIVSYGRYDNCLTANALDELNLDYKLVVESEEEKEYKTKFGKNNVLVVPEKYHSEYNTCDNLGQRKSQGPGPARNYAWDHSIEQGYDWHWIMDDNIDHFARYQNNKRIKVGDGSCFRCMEDFVLQYKNVTMAGPKYRGFLYQKHGRPPITINTRIYSCNLIRNDIPYRWRARYNEDTDLSLRMLKDGYCTILFRVFLQDKTRTQKLDGGNTENFYKYEGTYNKSKQLKKLHPDIVQLTNKGLQSSDNERWHHRVDYSPFKSNELKKKNNPDIEIQDYNYELIEKGAT